MNLPEITPLVLTWNEAPNIARCLDRLAWARRVVVLDSLSADGTREIAARFANVSWLERPFDNHPAQWNAGIDAVETEWVLALDADYILPAGFAEATDAMTIADDVDACLAGFRYVIFGRPLRGTLYPPRAVLFRKSRCRYEADGHTQLLKIAGRTEILAPVIDHDDRKPLSRWIASQDNYARLEAGKLLGAGDGLRIQDRVRRWIVVAPVLTFFYCLIGRGLILDGWRGWYYTWQRVVAEMLLSLRLLEQRFAAGK